MNILDAFYATVHDYPGGAEALAARMGMSATILRNKANPNNTNNKPMLEDAEKAMTLTGDTRILDVLAAAQGGVFVKIDASAPASDLAVLELVTHVCARTAMWARRSTMLSQMAKWSVARSPRFAQRSIASSRP